MGMIMTIKTVPVDKIIKDQALSKKLKKPSWSTLNTMANIRKLEGETK